MKLLDQLRDVGADRGVLRLESAAAATARLRRTTRNWQTVPGRYADTAKQLPHVSSLESVATLVTYLLSFRPLAGRIKPAGPKNRTESRASTAGGGMRPAVVVLGFVLGSAAAITFALGGHDDRFRRFYGRSILGSRASSVRCWSAWRCSRCSRVPPAAASTRRSRGGRGGARALAALLVMLVAVAAYHAWPRA